MAKPESPARTALIAVLTSVGIAIAATAIFGRLPTLGNTASIIAVAAATAPFIYGCYRATPPRPVEPNNAGMDPEVVRQKIVQRSEESLENPAYPPGEGPNRQSAASTNEDSKSTGDAGKPDQPAEQAEPSSQDAAAADSPETEFSWQNETDVCFDDIGGLRDVKQTLRAEILRPLANPAKADELGVAAPNLILHGPPGTGKTYTAKALATELGVPFVSLSGADIQSKWINESASMVADLFDEAQRMASQEDGAVVFIDELDSVLKSRSSDGNAHEEDNKVVNEFLTHLEATKEHNIVFVGATNRLDALDEAGIRSGRIDLKIRIGKPDADAREAILRAQLADRNHEITDEIITELAAATDGAVAAQLEQLVNRAAKNVLARGGDTIHPSDFE